jgi:hypothetical protein
MGIMETDRESAQKLHGQALEILTELAFDDFLKKKNLTSFPRLFYASFLRKRPRMVQWRRATTLY